MTTHLPECPAASWTGGPTRPDCYCPALRACEQRMFRTLTQPPSDAALQMAMEAQEELMAGCRAEGYAAGVQASRDAVAALPPVDQRVDDNGLISLVYDKGEALAAIDALRKVSE